MGGVFLNYPNFNKFKVYNSLKDYDLVKDYLPPTKAFKSPKDLMYMLNKYDSLYLKAFIGRKGKNVLRVDVKPNVGYKLSYFKKRKSGDELIEKTVRTSLRLQKEIDMFFRGKDFLIQKAIDLIEVEGRKVDMRAEVQKNKDGKLQIMGLSVRLGNKGAPITTHARAYKFNNFLKEALNYKEEEVQSLELRVNEFLLATYTAIEQCYGSYAEIGIDFAVDKNNKIWFIECNSQSAKVSLEKAYSADIYHQSFINVLEYARYASENS